MAKDRANDPKRKVVFLKGEDQSALWNRAKEQEQSHVKSDADRGGYIIGLNPQMTTDEVKTMGEMPVSAKGLRMGADAKHWLDRSRKSRYGNE
jgi:hypothetical protein